MKCLMALTCATAITLSVSNAAASDMPLPEQKPSYQLASTDPATLSEAKLLLEQISIELKKPAETVNAPAPIQTPAPIVAKAPPPPSQNIENLTVSRAGDIDMSCGRLSSEALHMRNVIYDTQDVKDRAKMQSHGITAAGAIGSFLIGSVTGGVGLAVGGFLLDQNVGQTEDNADSIQDTAAQRRTLMMGIYNAKGCEGPLEHAMQNPEIFSPLAKIASIETQAGGDTAAQYNE